ncbi:MAG: hypothetical protein GTO54_07075, partial [Nitrososphaeria archaeon]|nr:hypothetical protein [Nitrososphaeria archaeon]
GSGGIFGYILGYAVKKVVKILAVIGGLFSLGLIFLEYNDVIHINYLKLTELAEGGVLAASQWLSPTVVNIPFAGSFA